MNSQNTHTLFSAQVFIASIWPTQDLSNPSSATVIILTAKTNEQQNNISHTITAVSFKDVIGLILVPR
jgi:hypothetical protein